MDPKAKRVSALVELVDKLPPAPELTLALWSVGEDLHYAWFGMDVAEAVQRLQNVIAHIQTGSATNLGPSPTKH